ncbi:SPX-domain-containing protein [Piedraia hortae CBS 480.64]|uniref:SPX-domain-containing protein n=1 Tax=Piedraia hortae CBS 480.64 TaxID=1314780 RepID=A0A6A7C1Q9_9PEZI|nr:SPX-domain-containing protein [Piedraia hortae CBS 480.64]
MRFGRTLQLAIYPPWRDYYIDYPKLKRLLREDDGEADDWTEEDEHQFVHELVNVQLERVHGFHRDKFEKLREKTATCEARLDTIAQQDSADKTALKNIEGELDQITTELNQLEKYSRINYTGFLKSAKKHDRKRGQSYKIRPMLIVRLAALPFNREDYSPLLYRLSAMYNFVRQQLGDSDGRRSSTNDGRDESEEYVSHKFWVHPDNLLELKTMILRRLPVLVYNSATSRVAEGITPDPSITSIYLDNPKFSLYTKKVDRGTGSSVRLRWYGQLNDKPPIWVERKIVDEDSSTDKKFTTKEKYVQSYLNGDGHSMDKQIQKVANRAGETSNEVTKLKEIVHEIQGYIRENDLQPVLRANYTRTAFQIPGDNRVRVSLDTNLVFIREDSIDERPARDPESWHRTDIDSVRMEYPFKAIRKGEINRFPFAILELKVLRSCERRNEWINDLMNSHLVKESPRFSKFLHGIACLFEDHVNTLPFWLSQVETDIRRNPREAFEEEQAKKQKEQDDEFAVGSLINSKSLSVRKGLEGRSAGAKMSPVATETRTPKSDVKAGKKRVSPAAEDEAEPEEHEGDQSTSLLKKGKALPGLFGTSISRYAQRRRDVAAGNGGTYGTLPPGVTKPTYFLKDVGPVNVEEKVWLANQRTFIKWQHVSVLLAALSVSMLNAAPKDDTLTKVLALVYTLIAIFAGFWGYKVYLWRIKLIRERSGRDFDATFGPLFICAALFVGIVVNFVLRYRYTQQDGKEKQHM